MEIKNQTALCFLIRDDEVLLVVNNDRPGKVTWNGIAAEVGPKEVAAQKLVKEIYRLTKISAYERDLAQVGAIHYFLIDGQDRRSETLTINLYLCNGLQGQAINATGTRPTWFQFDQLPYEEMLEDSASWLPKILEGDKIIAEIYSKQDVITHAETIQDVLVRNII